MKLLIYTTTTQHIKERTIFLKYAASSQSTWLMIKNTSFHAVFLFPIYENNNFIYNEQFITNDRLLSFEYQKVINPFSLVFNLYFIIWAMLNVMLSACVYRVEFSMKEISLKHLSFQSSDWGLVFFVHFVYE